MLNLMSVFNTCLIELVFITFSSMRLIQEECVQVWTAALTVLVWSTVGRKEVNVYNKCSHYVRYDNKIE